MKVTLMPGIAAISGSYKAKNGTRVVFITRKAPTTNNVKTRMYIRPAESYVRKTPLSEQEKAARVLFMKRAAFVKQLIDSGQCKTRKEAWQIAKTKVQ